MNTLKKYLGLVWMALAPIAVYFLLAKALHEIAAKPSVDTYIQWGVFIFITIPIAIGLCIFGWYAFKEEYNKFG